MTEHARQLALQEDDENIVDSASTKEARRFGIVRARARRWWNEVCSPEWLVEVPDGLNGRNHEHGLGWYAMPRPEGKRCVLVAARGSTTSRTTSGDLLERFESHLPGGGRASASHTILDCVFTPSGEYWAMDVMCWSGYSLYDCTAEFRFYWLRTKLIEVGETRLRPTPYWECDPDSLSAAYASPLLFARDGILFYAKVGHYVLGLTPLVCLWKDEHTTRYWRGFDSCVLEISDEGRPSTLDGHVVTENSDPCDSRLKLRPGDLARFELSPHLECGLQARFVALCSAKRAAPDSSSKLAFSLKLRNNNPLTFEHIIQAASVPALPLDATSNVPRRDDTT